VVAAHEAVGVGIDGLGGLDEAAAVMDLDAALPAHGVVPEQDGLADQRGIDLVGDAVQTDRAVLLDFPLLLEEKEIAEIARQRDRPGVARPAIRRRVAVEAAVRGLVVLAFDTRPQASIERLEVVGVRLRQGRQQLEAHRPKPALELPFRQSSQMHTW